jgi:DNA recombination-dependent growth factor C
MQGRHAAIGLAIDAHTRATLTGWLRTQQTPVGFATRAQAMVRRADGQTCAATARQGG